MKFNIEKKFEGSMARAGVIETAHGRVLTPAYIAPATKAVLKALSNEDALDVGSQAMMMNTYHLMLEPGADIVARAGGLHKFSGWQGPIMTDSGGFQAFSLGEALGTGISKFTSWDRGADKYEPSQHEKRAKFDDDGVDFVSHIDGSPQRITPESSIQTQTKLGSDMMFVFDECVSPNAPRDRHISAIERTRLWAERCLAEHKRLQADYPLPRSSEKIPRPSALGNPPEAGTEPGCSLCSDWPCLHSKYPKEQTENYPAMPSGLFGVVQGGRYDDLRKKSAKDIAGMGFDGFGIGGSFVKEDMGTAVRWVCEELPEDKPRHLLGVGEPLDIFEAVENGIDTFDCVAYTRKARTGAIYTKHGEINITNAKYREHFEPIETDCACPTCRPANGREPYTCAYLHHLLRSHELLAFKLASIHNLYFITHLTAQIRQSIIENKFPEFKQNFLSDFSPGA